MKKILILLTIIILANAVYASTEGDYDDGYYSSAHEQADLVRVIPLRYKSADQVIPVLKPFLTKGAVIEGDGRKLIVKTDPGNLNEIRHLVQQIDRPPIQFLVTVRREGGQDNIALQHQPKTVYSTDQRLTRPLKQQIKVLEGKTVFVGSGLSFPVRSYGFGLLYGASASKPEYVKVESGFYLTPRLSGSSALVDINWGFQSLEDDQLSSREYSGIDQQSLKTQMSVPLGQWTKVSNTSEKEFHNKYTRIYDTNTLKNPPSNVYIKIDLANSRA